MPRAQIFISYRRDDAAGYARAVYDALARRFTAERVFMDVDDIGAGQAFDEAIQRAVGESEVLLVMIGKRWRGEREGRPPRISEAGDFVRREVTAGLAKGLRVIPLLLDGATMPTEAELPAPLRPLARRNAIEIGHTRFEADIERLVAALRETIGEPASRPPGTARWWGLAGALLAIALAVLWQWRAPSGTASGAASDPTASSAAAATSTARPDINGPWQADVSYDWPNARYMERFSFDGDGSELHGSASFLGTPRGILEGSTEPGGLRFVTRTSEVSGAAGSGVETVHRYRGRLVDNELLFVMQTEGGASPHAPVEFVARRAAAASGPR